MPLYRTKGGANYNNYSNAAVDDLLAKANTQLDFTQRQATERSEVEALTCARPERR